MKRKSFSLFLSLLLVFSMSIVTGATTIIGDTNINSEVETNNINKSDESLFALTCDCGGSFIGPVSTTTTEWSIYKYVQCKSNASKMDTVQSRDVIKTYRCNRCQLGYRNTTTEYKDNCASCNHM